MNMTKQDLRDLIRYCNTQRHNDERVIRRIKRNYHGIMERYNKIPKELISEDGIMSPDEEIQMLVDSKAKATILKKKLELELRK